MTTSGSPVLLSCPACEHSVSSQALTCPQCGHPLQVQAKQRQAVQHSRASGFIRFGAICTGLALPLFLLTLLQAPSLGYQGLVLSALGVALGVGSLVMGAVLGISCLAADRIGAVGRHQSSSPRLPLSVD